MFLKTLLFPLSVVYDWVTQIRNVLYDRGLKPSTRFELPVISVGNLTVGGTGKTPMVEYLIRLLQSDTTLATLSRGYGRTTRGFRIAGDGDNALTMGDEPFQFFSKFGRSVTVAVGEERALAIPLILHEKPETQVIILDDAFQHRRVNPSLNILLCDYHRPFYDDLVLPAGRLRESKRGAARADIVVVTKCPSNVAEDQRMEIEKKIRQLSNAPVFFSTVQYRPPVPFGSTIGEVSRRVIMVTGIANPGHLVDFVKQRYEVVEHLSFADHHNYTQKNLSKIRNRVREHPGCSVLTTEKDKVKLDMPELASLLKDVPLFYLPISVQFLKDTGDFDTLIRSHVSERP
jgi:tetraacyldisaccharide 4'-kinase